MIEAFAPLPDEVAIQSTQVNAGVASWTASPEYNPDTAGSYIFTPTLRLKKLETRS